MFCTQPKVMTRTGMQFFILIFKLRKKSKERTNEKEEQVVFFILQLEIIHILKYEMSLKTAVVQKIFF